jgi:hypothetical protein
MKSYLTPYIILGMTAGGTFAYVTDNLAFFPICFGCSIGMATLRDANIENNENNNTGNQLIKAISIYALGPLALIVSGGIAITIAYKK